MNLFDFFRGFPFVARQEFLANLKSVRLLIMVAVLALAVVGGAYGLSGGAGSGPSLPPILVWGHNAYAPNGSHLAVAWVSSPFGEPVHDAQVEFWEFADGNGNLLGRAGTDPNGYASLNIGNRTEASAIATRGQARANTVFYFSFIELNFTVSTVALDLDDDEIWGEVGVHVLTKAGVPAAARLLVNDTFVKDVDPLGYGLLELDLGLWNVSVEVAGETRLVDQLRVSQSPNSALLGTPDGTLLLIGALFLYLIVPIFAIVVTFDAVSKERVQGTLDLLLSRPVSRTGVLLGKFLGSFGAVAFPVTLVNLAGVGVITATSGRSPTGSFALAFLGLTLLLIAFYVLLQLVFSTLARTSGTAVLFGVLVWLLFNVLYSVLTFVIGAILFPDPAAAFQFQNYAGLGNPSSIYQQLLILSGPDDSFGFIGGTFLTEGILGLAATVWLAILLFLALFVFHKRAAV